MHFGSQNSFKTRPKLVEKLFFFRSLLFLVPRRSFDGFEASFQSFSLFFGELGAQKLWFLHRKRALFQERPFVDSCSSRQLSERLEGQLGPILGPKESPKLVKSGLGRGPKIDPKIYHFLDQFWAYFGVPKLVFFSYFFGSVGCLVPKWPKMAPRRPKTAQDGPKSAQDDPMMAPRQPKMAPRWPQDAPRRLKMAPRWLQSRKPLPQASPTGLSPRPLPQASPTGLSHRPLPQASPASLSHRPLPQASPTGLSHRPLP